MLTTQELEMLQSEEITECFSTTSTEHELILHLTTQNSPMIIEIWKEDDLLCLDYASPGIHSNPKSQQMDQTALKVIEKIKVVLANKEEYRLKLLTGQLEWKHCWYE